MSRTRMLIKGTNQEQTSFQHSRRRRHFKHRLPGTFWVNLLPSVLKHTMITCIMFPLIKMTDVIEAFERMQRFSWWPKSHPSHSDWALDSMIRRAACQLKDGAKLSDLNSSFERVNLNTTVSPPQTHYCNAWGGKMLQQNLKMFPSGTGDPAAYYFPCFSWRSLYWDFAIWLPRRAKMVRPNPILDHWRMQSFRVKTPLLRLWKCYISLGEFCMRNIVIYVSLENQCRLKHNMSCILASLWINVHSV